jgi:CheY-like chemotaxis protein
MLDGLRVLIVDDEEDARDLLAAVLSGSGATVVVTSSAAEGFDALTRNRPDVLLSDIAMPDEDGYSLIRRIRALPPEQGGRVPAIALTAYARLEDRKKALAMGFNIHLAKPVDPRILVSVVRTLVDSP